MELQTFLTTVSETSAASGLLKSHVSMKTCSLSSSRYEPDNAAAGNLELTVTAEVSVAATEVVDEEQADGVMREGRPLHRRTLRLKSVQPHARQRSVFSAG